MEAMNIESTFQDVVNEIKTFEAMNIESTFKNVTNAITRMQLQMTNGKAELEQLQRDAAEAGDQERRANDASVEARMETEKSTREQELQDVGGKIVELQKQAKPQPKQEAKPQLKQEPKPLLKPLPK